MKEFKILKECSKELCFKPFIAHVNYNGPRKEFHLKTGWRECLASGETDLTMPGFTGNSFMIKPEEDKEKNRMLVILDIDKKNMKEPVEFAGLEFLQELIESGKLAGEITKSGGLHIFLLLPYLHLEKSEYHPKTNIITEYNYDERQPIEFLIKKQCIVSSPGNSYIKGKVWLDNMKEADEGWTSALASNVYSTLLKISKEEQELHCQYETQEKTGGFYDLDDDKKKQHLLCILSLVSSDCDYSTWRDIGTILKGSGYSLAFQLFVSWSQRSSKFPGVSSAFQQWNAWDESKNHFGSFKKILGEKWKQYRTFSSVMEFEI